MMVTAMTVVTLGMLTVERVQVDQNLNGLAQLRFMKLPKRKLCFQLVMKNTGPQPVRYQVGASLQVQAGTAIDGNLQPTLRPLACIISVARLSGPRGEGWL